jgi:hypothetical protein
VAKPEAQKTWAKLDPDDQLVDRILLAVQQHRATDGWRKERGKYIPHPATWLNNRRWEDEIEADCVAPSGLALDRYQPSNGKVAL